MILSTIAKNFSRHASLYDKYAHVQPMAAKELIEKVCDQDYKRILDIGCGTGSYTLLLRNKFKNAIITGVDISGDMIDAARRKCGVEGISYIAADAENIQLPGKFDLITSNATFQWFDDLEASIERYREALTEGGRIVFSIFGPSTYVELNRSLKDVLGRDACISAEGFLTKDELSEIMNRFFQNIFIDERIVTEKYESLRQLLDSIKYTGTRGEGVENLTPGKRGILDKIEDAYLAKYGEIKATYQIFYCGADK